MRGFQLFSIGGIPVSISPWYLLLILFWLDGDGGIERGLLWGGVVTASILVHELGHALVALRYRLRPQILLWGLGGLTFHERADRDRHDALIIVAGPLAGLLLGLLVYLASLVLPPFEASTQVWVQDALSMSLWVNVAWSFVNLVPLWPLDGGQLFRLGLIQLLPPRLAEKITHGVALALVAAGLGVAYLLASPFLGILCAFAGWRNVQALRGEISSGTYRATSKHAKELLARAKQAHAEADYREAARLCHQLRSLDNPAEATMREAWAILGPATARLGDHAEALRYLGRAAATPEVVEAKVECLHQLDRREELDALLASREFRLLTPDRRAQILAVLRPTA